MFGILGVLVSFVGITTGLLSMSPHCRFNNQSVPCYGAVGHPLYLQLPPEDELRLKKDSGTVSIFKFKNKTVTQNHRDYPRWQFITENTTMIITSAKKIDSGNYTLDTFSSDGTNKGVYYLQLIIEDVVSSVKVTDSCWSPGNRSVYCSSDGDNLSFNWTLSGNIPTQQLINGSQSFLLDKEVLGSVTCLVENHVSRGNATTVLKQCPESTTMTSTANVTQPTLSVNDLLLITLSSVAVVLIVLAVIMCYIYRRKQVSKNTKTSKGDEELVYVQVTHKPKSGAEKSGIRVEAPEEEVEYASVVTTTREKKKKKPKQKDDEIQYGEVVFKTPAANQKKAPGQGQEECVYSHVQTR